jgi:hypothetical protein
MFSLALLSLAPRSLRRCFVSLRVVSDASIAALSSLLFLNRDADNVVILDVPRPFSNEAARMALISDTGKFSTTRFTAVASSPQKASSFRDLCSEQFIRMELVESASAHSFVENIIASCNEVFTGTSQQGILVPRAGSSLRATVGPLYDIVDRLAPHSFPRNFNFERHRSRSGPGCTTHPAHQSSRGLCFSDGILAFTCFNNLIFRHLADVHTDVVVGANNSGFKHGARDDALFSSPSGVYFHKHHGWLVADTLNHCVRCVKPDTYDVSSIPSTLFCQMSTLPCISTRTMPPLQLSHSLFKQSVFLAVRRLTSLLHLPSIMSHAIEWMMTGVNICRSEFGWQPRASLSLGQFAQMSRLFRFSEINSIYHVPLWRPHRIFSDGADGIVVVSVGRCAVLSILIHGVHLC